MKTKLSFCTCLLLAPLSALNFADELSVVNAPGPTWKRHTIDNTSKGADGVKLGDINRDGLQDIVTGWEEGGEVRVYLNPGPANSKELWPRLTVGRVNDPEDAIFVDLDGDGWLDVVSCTEGKTRTVFWHRFSGGDGVLTNTQSWTTLPFLVTLKTQSWMQAAAMDVDGKHGVDMILASKNEGGGIGWLKTPESLGDMNGWQYKRLREAGWIMTLTPFDMDNDGDLDVVFTDRKGTRTGAYWLENPGAKATQLDADWTEHTIGAVGKQAMFA
ncbi:MAG TPA: VCBS repeat-containing protein, partial [Pirellula sp.]|nr:VCBS repeat-containing protein [Pirellula sp.]